MNEQDGPTDEQYLFVVRYDDDAERKRAEYLFDNWSDGTVERPDGLVRIATGVDEQALYQELMTKVPEDQVTAYALDPVETDAEPESASVETAIAAPRQAVESFLDYVLSKRKAVLQSPDHNEYEVYTKKGRAEIRYSLDDADGETTVRVRIDGYPPAPSFLAEVFERELDEFSASQR